MQKWNYFAILNQIQKFRRGPINPSPTYANVLFTDILFC